MQKKTGDVQNCHHPFDKPLYCSHGHMKSHCNNFNHPRSEFTWNWCFFTVLCLSNNLLKWHNFKANQSFCILALPGKSTVRAAFADAKQSPNVNSFSNIKKPNKKKIHQYRCKSISSSNCIWLLSLRQKQYTKFVLHTMNWNTLDRLQHPNTDSHKTCSSIPSYPVKEYEHKHNLFHFGFLTHIPGQKKYLLSLNLPA